MEGVSICAVFAEIQSSLVYKHQRRQILRILSRALLRNTDLFGRDIGLFCGVTGLFCRDIRFFCGDTELSCVKTPAQPDPRYS